MIMHKSPGFLRAASWLVALFWLLIKDAECIVDNGRNAVAAITNISPGDALHSQTIEIGTETKWYLPVDLDPNRGYEIRVSVPATNPVDVILWIEEKEGGTSSGGRTMRALLDAEKVMFVTGENGLIVINGREVTHAIVGFRAAPRGVFKTSNRFTVLYYDIVLEENIAGVPVSAFPLILTAVIVVLVILAFIPYWTGTCIPALTAWLQDTRGTQTASKIS